MVPVYNYARFLERRLASVFAQTSPVARSDRARRCLHRRRASRWRAAPPRTGAATSASLVNAANSGSPFRQWRRAATLAEGEWLWIAEADDEADPGLLAALAALASDAPDVELVFCDSRSIDGDGRPIWPSYQDYYRASGAAELSEGGVFPAREFARRFLAERNLILNVSSVLWRRTSLLAALNRCGDDLDRYRLAGDWRLYLELLAASTGRVGVVATSLNVHRRHAAGVTASLAAQRHVDEVAQVQEVARDRLGLSAEVVRRQASYRRLLARELGAAPPECEPSCATPRRARGPRRIAAE